MDTKYSIPMGTAIDIAQALNQIANSGLLTSLFKDGDLEAMLDGIKNNIAIGQYIIGQLTITFAANGADPTDIADALGLDPEFIDMIITTAQPDHAPTAPAPTTPDHHTTTPPTSNPDVTT